MIKGNYLSGINITMRFSKEYAGKEAQIISLFNTTFTQSESAEEGLLIEALVKNQLNDTPANDIYVITAEDSDALVGACIFTRLTFEQDDRTVFILAPVAVTTEKQGQGIGKKLLAYGFQVLRDANVDIIMTYGDPNFYSKAGFEAVNESDTAAPFKLEYPHGWLGLSLNSQLSPLKGPSHCVSALNNPAYW